MPRGPPVNPSASSSPRSPLTQSSQLSSSGNTPSQTDAQPLPGQSCPGELTSGQPLHDDSADDSTAPGLSSERQENDENNNNNDDYTDLNTCSTPSQPTTSSAGLLAEQLNRHISVFDPNGIYPLPGASQQTGEFSQDHLQQHGLLNDGNICSLISLVLGLHRLGIKEHLIDPHYCSSLDDTPDFSAWILMKVLTALPSQQAFSLQLLIESWNSSNKHPRILPGFADIPSLAEGLISNLQVKQYADRPHVFTQFLGTYQCDQCQKVYRKVKNWEGQVQANIPLLQLPPNNQAVNPLELLQSHIEEPFRTRCNEQGCRAQISGGRLEVKLGYFTIIALSRMNRSSVKLMHRLEMTRNDQLIDPGQLVSIVCHRGDINRGHFVSYHCVDDQWFLNDDSRQVFPTNNPVENPSTRTETIELLLFKH